MNDINRLGFVIGVGDLAADLVLEIPALPISAGDLHIARSMAIEPGGTANFLIMVGRLGIRPAAMGPLGDDMWGREIASILRNQQVDLSLTKTEGTTTVAIVLVDDKGDHVFIGKYGEGPQLRWHQRYHRLMQNAGAVFSSGYSLAEDRLTEFTISVFEQASKMGIQRFFDPGPAFSQVDPQQRDRILALSEILLLTDEEVPVAVGDDFSELFRKGPSIVVVKRGPHGCAVYTRDGSVSQYSGLPVGVRDTTAAGDSFDAGFVAGMIRGWSLDKCAMLANAVGAAKVQKLGGGRNVPTIDDVRAVADEFSLDLEL